MKDVVRVSKWIKQYGGRIYYPLRIEVETMKEIDELKAVRNRIRELEAALAGA